MGIDNLLPSLKSCMDPVHVRQYAGKRVAVDAYAWLHRGAYTCSQELCLGQPTTKWLQWCMSRCRMLLEFGLELVMVFDGGRLPRKEGTEKERKAGRDKNRALAMQFLQSGDRDAAYKLFQKAVDITPSIARTFIVELRKLGPKVTCIVAPYEADAQLAFLSQRDLVHAVITEDSDLIPFGCKRILFKMDGAGSGLEFRLRNLESNADLKFLGWTHAMFQQMCIMAGCDYLNSMQGIGIKRAHALLAQHRSWDRAIRRVRLDGKVTVPPSYERDFELALLTFNHQRVYDPDSKSLVHLTEPPPGFQTRFPDSAFLGPALPDDIACGIAEGRLDPDTHQPFIVAPPPSLHFAPGASDAPAGARPAYENYVPPPRVMDGSLPGFVKKHSTAVHHQQQLSISAMFPRHPHQFAAAAAAAAAAGSSSDAAAAAVTLGPPPTPADAVRQKIYNVVGALIDEHPHAALAPIPSELKQDFRPPRRAERACRDVTNTLSSSQPHTGSTPAKSASLPFTQLRAPHTHPQKARDRLSLFDQFAFGSTSRARAGAGGGGLRGLAHRRGISDEYDAAAEEEDAYGFSREEEEAEAVMRQEEAAGMEEEQEESTPIRIPPPRRPNFLHRSNTSHTVNLPPPRMGAAAPSSVTAGTSGFFSPPSDLSRADICSPPPPTPSPGAPMTFTLPPATEKALHPVTLSASPSPSPPPHPAQPASTGPTSSKYFSAARPMLVRLRHSTGSILPPRPAPVVPDATAFLHVPPVAAPAPAPAAAAGGSSSDDAAPDVDLIEEQQEEVEDDDEGRISDIDPDILEQPLVDSTSRAAGGSRKRARAGRSSLLANASVSSSASSSSASASLSFNAERFKRFKSPLMATSRMTLPLHSQSSIPLPLPADLNFDAFKRTQSLARQPSAPTAASAPASAATAMDMRTSQRTPSPSQSASPPSVQLISSAAVARPFRPLTVQAGTRTIVPRARPPLRAQSESDARYNLSFSSPPSDSSIPPTPPSPSPSPRADPSPSPSPSPSASSPAPSPPTPAPVLSAPYVEHAAAGFSSQPSDDEWEEEPQGQEEAEKEQPQQAMAMEAEQSEAAEQAALAHAHPSPVLQVPSVRPPPAPVSFMQLFRYQQQSSATTNAPAAVRGFA